jgi:hypothetical protein
LKTGDGAIIEPTVESDWSPQKVAELYEHAEQALQRAEALAQRTTTAGSAADETPSAHPQAEVAGEPPADSN